MTRCCVGRMTLVAIGIGVLLWAGCEVRHAEWTSSEGTHVPEIPEGEPWQFGDVEGRIIKTEHFTVYTTARDALLLERLGDFLEGAYERYLAFLPPAEDDEEPLVIYLFGQRSEWEQYTRDTVGALAETYLKIRAGAYSHNGTCVAYMLERYHTFGVLAHEGFHQFAHRRLGHRIPPWMEEGLACNFEAHVWEGGEPEFTPDLNEFRISSLKRALRNDWLFSLEELVGLQAGLAIDMPPEKTATFYAQAWALTRFLQEGEDGKYRKAFDQLLDDAASGADLAGKDQAMQIFESYFRESSDVIAEEAAAYARLLADRQIEPGMDIIIVSAEPTGEKIQVTAEQIEQAKPVIRIVEPPEPEPAVPAEPVEVPEVVAPEAEAPKVQEELDPPPLPQLPGQNEGEQIQE